MMTIMTIDAREKEAMFYKVMRNVYSYHQSLKVDHPSLPYLLIAMHVR